MTDQAGTNQDFIAIITKIYLFVKRYFIILIIFLLVGIALGIYEKYTAGFYYKKHMIINSTVIHKNISLDLVNSIQQLIDDGDIAGIAQKLNIPDKAAASIIKVDTGSFMSRKNLGFLIDLQLNNNIFADTITSGLIYYLNNNEYIRENTQLYIQERQKVLELIQRKINQIDSLNNKANFPYTAVGSENAIIVRSFSTEYINLMEKKYSVEQEIEFGSKISVVEQTISKISTGRSLIKSVIFYGIGIGILGLFLALFIEMIRLARINIRQSKK